MKSVEILSLLRKNHSMKKNFFRIILVLLCACLLFSCAKEYDEHFYAQRNIEGQENVGSGDFASAGEIISFPRKWGDDFLISVIESAKNRIWIEIYTFTKNEKIFQALLDTKNRGVDVQVLLEWNVYGTPAINNQARKFFRENHISVKYTDNNRYVFTHAKFWLIDEDYYISTGNWTRSFFTKNREYIYRGSDESTRKFLEKIFQVDFAHKWFSQLSEIPPQIVMSPINSRHQIEKFINETNDEILIYVQTVTDPNIINLLQKLDNNGKKVIVCTADNEGNRAVFETSGLDWILATEPYLHAKIMLRDDGNIFLWSENFTTNSLDNNREMGILLENRLDIFQKIREDFRKHCGS